MSPRRGLNPAGILGDAGADPQSLVKTKFHYASWFEAGSKLVADRFEACHRPASNLSATSFEPASVIEFGFEGESRGIYLPVAQLSHDQFWGSTL